MFLAVVSLEHGLRPERPRGGSRPLALEITGLKVIVGVASRNPLKRTQGPSPGLLGRRLLRYKRCNVHRQLH
jgi:hypothetical protein